MGDIRITLGDASRLDDLEPLWKALHEHHRSVASHLETVAAFRTADASWERRRTRYEAWLEDEESFLVLAERDGRAVGYALVVGGGPEATLETGERTATLESLVLLPDERGSGLGTALMEAVDEELRRRGVNETLLAVMEGNENALRFYERRGYVRYLTFMIGRPGGSET